MELCLCTGLASPRTSPRPLLPHIPQSAREFRGLPPDPDIPDLNRAELLLPSLGQLWGLDSLTRGFSLRCPCSVCRAQHGAPRKRGWDVELSAHTWDCLCSRFHSTGTREAWQ